MTLTPEEPEESSLALLNLVLQQNTRVRQLTYNPYSKLLSLSLQSNRYHFNKLRLDTGSAPLKVTLTNYRLPTLNLRDDSNPLEFTLKTTQFELQIPKQASLEIELPDSDNNFSEKISVSKM